MTTAEQLKREGRIEGKVERDVEIVKNALQMGLHRDQIIQLTGLPVEEIDKIEREMSDE